jgi:transposase
VKVSLCAIITYMPAPLFVRSLTKAERAALQVGRRATKAFTLRHSQILLASAEGHTPRQIAQRLGCGDQTVRNALRAFAREGIGSLQQKSSRPKTTTSLLDAAKADKLRDLLHSSPRALGKARSTWTLVLVAEVCAERGLTPYQVSDETIRTALRRLDINWKRAKHWISSPDPAYGRKKRLAIG